MDVGKGVGKNILEAFKMLAMAVGVIGAMFLGAFIITIILGAVFFVAQDGDLPITTGANSTLTSMETSFNSVITTVISASGFAAALLSVAIILVIFAGFGIWGYKTYKGAKSGSRSTGY